MATTATVVNVELLMNVLARTGRVARKPAKQSRKERVKANRRALMKAAAEIVCERGYEGTSVARVTERAGLAHGTFYRYFDSRQDLFDQLLPEAGDELLGFLRGRTSGARHVLELEERAFRGFFEFLRETPGFYRLLNEAEIMAPLAFERHIDNMARHYVAALERSRARGELRGFERRELEVLAFVLMAARFYIYLRFAKSKAGAERIPEWVVAAYMKFVKHGFGVDGTVAATREPSGRPRTSRLRPGKS
jgi:AcrR family transcriptional regulator